jgi:2-polyprenyl-6-methoxyphenol hydroxylase-like FAD-dependent oxidoreductase
MSGKSPIVIIGAGVGGLTLALLLRRRGILAEVLEQSGELREVGAAVSLAANATRVLRQLGLGEALAQVSTEPTRLIHRDGRDGRQIAATPGPQWYRDSFGAPFFGLHRAALQRLLADAFGPEHLHLGFRAESLEERDQGMLVRCSSGTTFKAGVVVGADGVHSLVRDWVTGGDQPVYSGTSGFRGLVPIERLPLLPDPGALQFWMGPGAHLLHYPIDGGRLINFLAVIDTPGQWTAPDWLEAAEPGAHLEAFAGWHPAVSEMLGAVPQSPRWGLFARRALARWSRGPAVLLGDAAHAMLPHQGQGANQTIEDAAVLAAELDGASDAPAALRRYADRRQARTRKVQLLSWAASAALHLADGPAAERRDAYLAQLPEHLAWIHGYDVLSPARDDLVGAAG